MKEKWIKLHCSYPPLSSGEQTVAGENIWAYQLSADTAKIGNIPIGTNEFTQNDLVRFDQHFEIVAVLERGPRFRQAAYDRCKDDESAALRFKEVEAYLRQFDIVSCSMGDGHVLLAVPNDLDDDKLADICANSPI